jgi:hypothetical protein
MKRFSCGSLWAGIGIAIAISAIAWWKYQYPYGHRPCLTPCLDAALQFYAKENGGWFPRGGANPIESLRVLYPSFADEQLAGITGDRARMRERLKNGRPLLPEDSSWHYVEGLRHDDGSNVAIMWETRSGVSINGRRDIGRRVVIFAAGGFDLIPDEEWPSFVAEQEALHRQIFLQRGENE